MHPSDDKNLKAALQQTPSEDGLPASIRQTILDTARVQAQLNQQPAKTVVAQDSQDNSVILFGQRKATAPVAETVAAGTPKKRWTYGLATAAVLLITVGLSRQLMQQSTQLPPQVATQQVPAVVYPTPVTTADINATADVNVTSNPAQPPHQPATDTLAHYSVSHQASPAAKPSRPLHDSRPDSELSATVVPSATHENSYEAASYAGQPEVQADIEKTLQQVQHLQQSGQLGDAVGLLLALQKKYPQVQLPQSMCAILPVQETVTLSHASRS